jgi:hypothetical protein
MDSKGISSGLRLYKNDKIVYTNQGFAAKQLDLCKIKVYRNSYWTPNNAKDKNH